MRTPNTQALVEQRVIMRAGQCGIHSRDKCDSCQSAWESNDYRIQTLEAEVARLSTLNEQTVELLREASRTLLWHGYTGLSARIDAHLQHLPDHPKDDQPAPYTCKHGCERDEIMQQVADRDEEIARLRAELNGAIKTMELARERMLAFKDVGIVRGACPRYGEQELRHGIKAARTALGASQ